MNTAIPLPLGRWQHGVLARGAHRQGRRAAAALDEPALSRGERTLARNVTAVATDQALHLRDDATLWRSVPWSTIATARWAPAAGVLTVEGWPTPAGRAAGTRFTADAAFARVVAERVNASRVLCVVIDLGQGLRGTVLALRTPTGAALQWRVVCSSPDGDIAIVPEQDWPAEVREIQALAE